MAATAAIAAAAAANETVAAPLAALALAAELEADAERVDAPRTAEEESAGMEEVRAAAVEFGDNAKAHSWHGWAGTMARRFRRFLQRHGERLGYEEGAEADADGPDLEVVRQFIDWCWAGYARLNFSPVGRKADADKYYELHLPYTLAQRCFVMLELPGWVGLEKHELDAKAASKTILYFT